MEIKAKEAKVQKSGIGAGLYNYGDFRHALGCENKSQVPKSEQNKYITGLDKYTPSIRSIVDEKEREKAIKELDKKRKELEARLGVTLDQDTTEGKDYWLNFTIDFDELEYLNKTNPYEELMMIVIRANAEDRSFPVALSKEQLGGDVINSKDYYVVDNEKELKDSVSKKVLYSKCVARLSDWFTTDETKLKNMAFLVLPRTIPITSKTDPGYLFTKLSDHLDGTLYEDKRGYSQIKTLTEFLEYDRLPTEELDLKVTVDKAIKYNIISKNTASGEYYNRVHSEYRYGKTLDDVYAYFKNTENQEELGINKKTDKEYSLKYLINQKEI